MQPSLGLVSANNAWGAKLMDAFSYLSVLLAVIIGLAVTQVLQGYRSLALARSKIRWYAPPLIWSVLILILVTQHWWANFGLSERSDWSFAQFGATLLQTALLYMMAALVLPDVQAGEPTDLKAHYYREAPLFFGIGAASILWNAVRELTLYGALPQRLDLGFQLLFLLLSTACALVRRERFHELVAGLMVFLFAAYIILLFARL